jgi:aspartyl-tRNA synthetase
LRKERDDLKPLFNGKGLSKVFEDFGRLEKSFPEALAKVRTKVQAESGDLVVLVAGVAKPAETATAASTF